MSTTSESINKKLTEIKAEEKAIIKTYNWFNKEIKQDEKSTIQAKELFINEIKSDLGDQIRNSDLKPKKIEIKRESFLKRLLKMIFR